MKAMVFFAAIFLPTLVLGQSAESLRRQADEEHDAGRYESAIVLYRQALQKNDQLAEAYIGIADSYRESFQYREAEKAYRKVRNTWVDQFPLSIFYYGLMLKLNGNFQASIDEFESFIKKIGNSGRYPDFAEQAYVEKAGAELAMFMVDQGEYQSFHFDDPVNTSFNDFSPEIFDENVLLLTSGREKGWSTRKDLRYGEGFMDQYAFKKQGDSWQEVDFSLLKAVNGKFHEGNGTFNSARNKFYFTSCGDDSPQCRIMLTELDSKGEWRNPRPLTTNVNRPGSNSKQPSLSTGGDSLFFVSDRPGGLGKNDIWVSVSTAGENWSTPKNLTAVNTSLNELSPAMAGKDLLMFSSEGHQSYGGFDLYLYKMNSEGERIVNAGMPLNSNRDDAYAVLRDTVIYWSSNREGGLGNFDIYAMPIHDPEDFLNKILESAPTAMRSEVGKREKEEQKKAKVNLADDPFAYESLTDRQKRLINEVITSRRAGRAMPAELEYLDKNERSFILKLAEEKMKKSGEN